MSDLKTLGMELNEVHRRRLAADAEAERQVEIAGRIINRVRNILNENEDTEWFYRHCNFNHGSYMKYYWMACRLKLIHRAVKDTVPQDVRGELPGLQAE